MSRKPKPVKDAWWAEAKRKCRLNVETVRMAKELGLNPRKLIKNVPSKSQPWKAPVHVWIRDLYEEHRLKMARRQHGEGDQQAGGEPDAGGEPHACGVPPARGRRGGEARLPDPAPAPVPFLDEGPDEFAYDDEFPYLEEYEWRAEGPPGDREIAEENEAMLRRQQEFQVAAEWVAEALSRIAAVRRVVLFGSVASPLKKEVPRFRRFQRAGVAIWHECKDVDLAVWFDDPSCLRQLQKARSRALSGAGDARQLHVAHHQVEIFILEPATDRYLGRLCCFGNCPKGKPECEVPGCGATPFLRQHKDFTLRPEALAAERTLVLYDRDQGPSEPFDAEEIEGVGEYALWEGQAAGAPPALRVGD